jgi:transposase-like protein
MPKCYQIAAKSDAKSSRDLARFFVQNAQAILPMVELIEQSQIAVDSLLEVLGRATLEAVLSISASELAGPSHQGVRGRNAEVLRHGTQPGSITLSDRKMALSRPRLRRRGGGSGAEVGIPAYEAMQSDTALQQRILSVMMRGVSTRNYQAILPEACEAAGVKKSSVSRHFVAASAKACEEFALRRFDDKRLLVIYVDGMVFGEHRIVAGVGIDNEGRKHVLGVREGATENAACVTGLLEDMLERGVGPDVNRLFVIDGSKALRQAIKAVYGDRSAVQRCRVHKVRNVTDHLPKERRADAKKAMQAAFRLGGEDGRKKLSQLASWYDKEFPSAAASLREGLEELFTVDRLGVTSALTRCLVSTNLIESPNAGVRLRTGRVDHWQDGSMALRWATTAFIESEARFRRVQGYKDLWMLDAALNPKEEEKAA